MKGRDRYVAGFLAWAMRDEGRANATFVIDRVTARKVATELEQSERRISELQESNGILIEHRDEQKSRAEQAERERDEFARKFTQAEAQLAKVPALVEALRKIHDTAPEMLDARWLAGQVLSKWEQAQGEKP